jgi:hypothetical protein
LFLFTFQSIQLVIKWVGGATNAFGSYPKANSGDVWSYAVVNLIIAGVGIGLLALGRWLGSKRRASQPASSVEPAPSAGVRVSS